MQVESSFLLLLLLSRFKTVDYLGLQLQEHSFFAQYQASEYGALNHTLSQDLFITYGQLCSVLKPPLDPAHHHPLVEKQLQHVGPIPAEE